MYYSSGNYEAFARPEKPEGVDHKSAYLIGTGLAALSAACFLVRDAQMPGKQIHIFEKDALPGGACDGYKYPGVGYVMRGGREMDNHFECMWDLFRSIPSIETEGVSVLDEYYWLNKKDPNFSLCRATEKQGQDAHTENKFGLSDAAQQEIMKLFFTPDEDLYDKKITDFFDDEVLNSNFWMYWRTMFAFANWHSALEMKLYIKRFVHHVGGLPDFTALRFTRYNQYESMILPLKAYLDKANVDFSLKMTVTDLDFEEGDDITVTAIHYDSAEGNGTIQLHEGDLCIVTNGCITDNATIGDLHKAAPLLVEKPMSGELWSKIAAKRTGLGNPQPFFSNAEETNWESFTVTLKGDKLLKMIEKYSRNVPGSGALMTFKDSNWLMSIVVAAQPHFKAQPKDQTIFWGYGLYTDKVGDYVKKPMRECTGEEMLLELLHHLHFDDEIDSIMKDVINVIPAMMPYIDSHFQPRAMADRPKVVPEGSTNLAFISQFVEIPEDMVFTEEYSVRAARIAVYTLLGLDKKICPVTPHRYDVRTLLKALNTAYR